MSTKNPRLNVVLEPPMYQAVCQLAHVILSTRRLNIVKICIGQIWQIQGKRLLVRKRRFRIKRFGLDV